MAFFSLWEDMTGKVEVLVFRTIKLWKKVVALLEDDKIVQVIGRFRFPTKTKSLNFIADDIKELPNDEVYNMALNGNGKKLAQANGFAYELCGQYGSFKIK